MRSFLVSSALWSLSITGASAQSNGNGGELKSLEDEALTLLGEALAQDYTHYITEIAGVLASNVPASAVISDLPALVTEIQPQLTAFESEVAAFFTAELASIAAPPAIISAAPAIATDLIADAVSILEDIITSEFSATMAITAVPAALVTAEAEVLSLVPELGKELFSELGPDFAPVSKQLASWLPGAISTWEGVAGSNATAGVPSSTSVVPATGGANVRSVAGGTAGGFALLAIVGLL